MVPPAENVPTVGPTAGSESVYFWQSVPAGQVRADDDTAVANEATAEDCWAAGTVIVSEVPIPCSAETATSAETGPVLPAVVTKPVSEAGPVLVPVWANICTLPSELPGCTPTVTVVA